MSLPKTLLDKQKNGQPILAVMTGSGQVGKISLDAGADIVFALNAGIYRGMGIGSLAAFLPYGNANHQTENLLNDQFLSLSHQFPLVAGAFAHSNPEELEDYLNRLKKIGVEGVTNWPSVGLLDGSFRAALERDNYNVDRELQMLKGAKAKGFHSFGFVWNAAEARAFSDGGVDCLIVNLGLTKEIEDVREHQDQLQINIQSLRKILEALKGSKKSPICLIFGGVINDREDLETVLRNCNVDGFAGGSVFDRIPVQNSVNTAVRHFKSAFIRPGAHEPVRSLGGMIGNSGVMKVLFDTIRKIASADVNVYIEGESGTGKELVASQMHQLSQRSDQPFVTLNCGAIPDTLFESELFGHEKGSFTGADRRRLGKFELAHGGILFLDEVSDLSPHGQVALLRSIQQREITRVGGEKNIPIDVRILAASNRNLLDLVNEGRFRADLYYRLNGVTILVPPLRERMGDIPLLVKDILRKLQVRLNKEIKGISPRFISKLEEHSWPGNVRELEHVICESSILEDSSVLQGSGFKPLTYEGGGSLEELVANSVHREKNRKIAAENALELARGNKSKAAKMLNVTRKTLYSWLEHEDEP